jgi:hypothetical protein
LAKRPEKKYPIDGPWLNGGLIKCFENVDKGIRWGAFLSFFCGPPDVETQGEVRPHGGHFTVSPGSLFPLKLTIVGLALC